MSKLFMYGSDLQELEKLMMLVTNFLPRRNEVIVVQRIRNAPEFLQHGRRSKLITDYCGANQSSSISKQIAADDISYEEILGRCFEKSDSYPLKRRLIERVFAPVLYRRQSRSNHTKRAVSSSTGRKGQKSQFEQGSCNSKSQQNQKRKEQVQFKIYTDGAHDMQRFWTCVSQANLIQVWTENSGMAMRRPAQVRKCIQMSPLTNAERSTAS